MRNELTFSFVYKSAEFRKMTTVCGNVASCLGLSEEDGVIRCDFQDKLSDIHFETQKTNKEFKYFQRRSLRGVRTWLVVLTVIVVLMFFLCIWLWYQNRCVQRTVCNIEGLLLMPLAYSSSAMPSSLSPTAYIATPMPTPVVAPPPMYYDLSDNSTPRSSVPIYNGQPRNTTQISITPRI
jgi:hypothetical protein